MIAHRRTNGFTLIELVITVAVLAILTLGVIPLVRVSVQRQKEEQLRAALREMREAIDQFHREALIGASMQAAQQQGQMTTAQQEQAARSAQAQAQQNMFGDPRVRVFISDQTIFGVDNPDRFPPTLETLVNGVDVLPLTAGGLNRRGNLNYSATEAASEESVIPKTKIYLRRIPIDPMTGNADWCFTSSYDPPETNCGSGGGENVFNVHSKSDGTPLDGKGKYSDW
jgi:general secretion pathway protein G